MSFATFGCKEGGQMSTAMELIMKAKQEKKGILILICGEEMGENRIPIILKYKDPKTGEWKETDEHPERKPEITIEVDVSNPVKKVGRICNKERTKVRVHDVYTTGSYKKGKPAYAFMSAHVIDCFNDFLNRGNQQVELVPEVQNPHAGAEW